MKLLEKRYIWLVTGGAGFIGSNLCKHLIKNNQKVICIDNFSTGSKNNISVLIKSKNFKLLHLDIRDINKIKRFKVNFVIHLAALGSVSRSFKKPIETNSVNVGGSLEVLKYAKINKAKKFIFASSSSVYGDLKKEFKAENDITNPISPYGISKLLLKNIQKLYRKN